MNNKLFRFGFFKGWANLEKDRSNFPAVLRAFCQEFKKDEPVELVVKFNPAYFPPGWDLTMEIKKLNVDLQNAPNVRFLLENVPFATLRGLYEVIDVMVSASHGEAFDLPLAEAMAMGIPCIAPNFGGQMDFLNHTNAWILSTKPAPCTDPNFIYEECQWGEIDIADLRKAMRNAYEDATGRQGKAKKALSDISTFTWDNSAKKALDAVKQL